MATTYSVNIGLGEQGRQSIGESGNNSIVQTDNGYLFALRYWQTGYDSRLHLMRSTDKGKTWDKDFKFVGNVESGGVSYWETASIFAFGNIILIVARSGGYEMRTFTYNATAAISTGIYGDIYAGDFMTGFMATYDLGANRFMIIYSMFSYSQRRNYIYRMTSTDMGANWTFIGTGITNFNGYGGLHRLSNGKIAGFGYHAYDNDSNRYLYTLIFDTYDAVPTSVNVTGSATTAFNGEFKTVLLGDVVYCLQHRLNNVTMYSLKGTAVTMHGDVLTNVDTNHYITATTDGKNLYLITADRAVTKVMKMYVWKGGAMVLINTISLTASATSEYRPLIDAPPIARGGIYVMGNRNGYSNGYLEFNAQTLAYSRMQKYTGTGVIDTEVVQRWDGVNLAEVTPNYWDGVKLVPFD